MNLREHLKWMDEQLYLGRHWQTSVLLDIGKDMKVQSGTPKMTIKECFTNSLERAMLDGTDYVEGVGRSVVPMTHAWNRDGEDYYDFTWRETDREYLGVVIPKDVAWEVMRSRRWPIGDGVLGTISMLSGKRRAAMYRKIVKANT